MPRDGFATGGYRGAREAALEEAPIADPVILVRINRLYRPNMSPDELYEVTRSAWVVGDRRERARYALAVFEGQVLEVYHIERWQQAETAGRWEFRGHVADESIRDEYVGRSVRYYLRAANQNPIVYVNC